MTGDEQYQAAQAELAARILPPIDEPEIDDGAEIDAWVDATIWHYPSLRWGDE